MELNLVFVKLTSDIFIFGKSEEKQDILNFPIYLCQVFDANFTIKRLLIVIHIFSSWYPLQMTSRCRGNYFPPNTALLVLFS